MEENTFDASAVALKSRLAVDLVASNIPWPILPEARSTSRTLLQIRRKANLLFKTVDVLGIVPNQLASITQTKDEAMYFCWAGVLNSLTHLRDVAVEDRPPFRIGENRRIKETTKPEGINAIL